MSKIFQSEETNDTTEIELLFSISARMLIKSPDPTQFLDWIAEYGPELAPELAAQVDPRTGPPSSMFRTMGVALYSAIPQPEAGYQPVKLAFPGRNELCLCGSGAKYKHCCLSLEGILDFSGFNLLRYVLDLVPQKEFAVLPKSHAEPLAVADTARQWQEEENYTRTQKLLEPWFKNNVKLNKTLVPLFDELMECYLVLGAASKRERLIKDALDRGDTAIKAAALQRRSMILADQGEIREAWEAFEQAQRLDPDDITLVTLELTLLMSQGKIEQVRQRAQFWLARLQRMHDPQVAPLVDFVLAARDNPLAALNNIAGEEFPEIVRLTTLLAEAPPPEAMYRVEHDAERLLEPSAPLIKIDQLWDDILAANKPSPDHFESTLLDLEFDASLGAGLKSQVDFLANNSLAWQSFEVLYSLSIVVTDLQILGSEKILVEPILTRGVELLKLNLGIAETTLTSLSELADFAPLPWAWRENRAALSLLAERTYYALHDEDRGTASDDFIEHAVLLMALNPNDNHGIREPLSLAYLARGWQNKTVMLTDQYPEDFCGPTLNRILALLRLNRENDALTLLKKVADRHSVALKMLLAKNPRTPKSDDDYGVVLGSKEEAWLYRTAARAVWELDGSLDWLKKNLKKI